MMVTGWLEGVSGLSTVRAGAAAAAEAAAARAEEQQMSSGEPKESLAPPAAPPSDLEPDADRSGDLTTGDGVVPQAEGQAPAAQPRASGGVAERSPLGAGAAADGGPSTPSVESLQQQIVQLQAELAQSRAVQQQAVGGRRLLPDDFVLDLCL